MAGYGDFFSGLAQGYGFVDDAARNRESDEATRYERARKRAADSRMDRIYGLEPDGQAQAPGAALPAPGLAPVQPQGQPAGRVDADAQMLGNLDAMQRRAAAVGGPEGFQAQSALLKLAQEQRERVRANALNDARRRAALGDYSGFAQAYRLISDGGELHEIAPVEGGRLRVKVSGPDGQPHERELSKSEFDSMVDAVFDPAAARRVEQARALEAYKAQIEAAKDERQHGYRMAEAQPKLALSERELQIKEGMAPAERAAKEAQAAAAQAGIRQGDARIGIAQQGAELDRARLAAESPERAARLAQMGAQTEATRAGIAQKDRALANDEARTAASGGKPKELPSVIAKARTENAVALDKIGRAEKMLDERPQAFGLKNMAGDTLMQRMDPDGVEARALIADIGSLKIHDRSGAAVSAAEFPRLKPFVPQATDTPETIRKKLGLFRQEYQRMQAEIDAEFGAAKSSARPASVVTIDGQQFEVRSRADGKRFVQKDGRWFEVQ